MVVDEKPTLTVFRKFKDGAVIALFPEIPANRNGDCQSYMHVGQHGAACYYAIINNTTPCSQTVDVAPLQKELESIGYVIEQRTRIMPKVHRQRQEDARK